MFLAEDGCVFSLFFFPVQVCPADGRVLHLGRVDKNGRLEQIKGVTYQLKDFLGEQSGLEQWSIVASTEAETGREPAGPRCEQPSSHSVEQEDSALFHVCIYLAPGDYHGFHSPANWNVHTRRHFPGTVYIYSPAHDLLWPPHSPCPLVVMCIS